MPGTDAFPFVTSAGQQAAAPAQQAPPSAVPARSLPPSQAVAALLPPSLAPPQSAPLSPGAFPGASPSPLPVSASLSLPPPAAIARPALPPLAIESDILARAPQAPEALRFAAAPEIVVLQFASLADQADTLNRAAALLERAGYPRDRVLDLAEMDRRIRAAGDTPERVYLGHDYRAADLLRFFAVADRAGTPLTPGEQRLRRLVAEWGWTPGITAALITLVRDDHAAGLDPAARATILRHELSHGLYFTSPAYARFARLFWAERLTEAERGRFRTFLASEGYDTGDDDLVVNETQAYLMHTADARFFNAAVVGIPARRLDALRVLFLSGMPPGWLRDCTAAPGPPR